MRKAAQRYRTWIWKFLSHVRKVHPEEYQLALADNAESVTSQRGSDASLMFYTQKVVEIYGWLNFVVDGLQPFSVTENSVFRKFSRHGSISCTILMKYLDSITKNVEKRIARKLPDRFSIAFDGWTCSSTHYVAIFASYFCFLHLRVKLAKVLIVTLTFSNLFIRI